MVEAMVEQTPEFYSKFRKQFRYEISFTKPSLDATSTLNFAFGKHTEDQNTFCQISEHHYHVLIEVDVGKKPSKTEKLIPCLYSTYFFLLHRSDGLEKNGVIMQKLHRAVLYNEKHGENSFFKIPKNKSERLPKVRLSRNIAVQTEDTSMLLLNKIVNVLNSSQAANLYRILDILTDGQGSYFDDSVNFTLKTTDLNEKKVD